MQLVAHSGGSPPHGIELHFVVVRIQQSVKLRPAGIHSLRHFAFGEVLRLHRLKVWRSSSGRLFGQSRTGSVPLSER